MLQCHKDLLNGLHEVKAADSKRGDGDCGVQTCYNLSAHVIIKDSVSTYKFLKPYEHGRLYESPTVRSPKQYK